MLYRLKRLLTSLLPVWFRPDGMLSLMTHNKQPKNREFSAVVVAHRW